MLLAAKKTIEEAVISAELEGNECSGDVGDIGETDVRRLLNRWIDLAKAIDIGGYSANAISDDVSSTTVRRAHALTDRLGDIIFRIMAGHLITG